MKKIAKPFSAASSLFSLMLQVSAGTLLGGLLFAGAAYFFGHPYFASGLLLGALLALFNLLALHSMVGKVLKAGETRGLRNFWARHVIRWILFALICWGLIQISVFCLLGALAGYSWFLAVLAFVGWRNALHEKNPSFQT